jgi:hypothetical protein
VTSPSPTPSSGVNYTNTANSPIQPSEWHPNVLAELRHDQQVHQASMLMLEMMVPIIVNTDVQEHLLLHLPYGGVTSPDCRGNLEQSDLAPVPAGPGHIHSGTGLRAAGSLSACQWRTRRLTMSVMLKCLQKLWRTMPNLSRKRTM